MTSPLRFRACLLAVMLVVFFTSSPASAIPVNYTIFDTDTLLELGTFTVDPSLANPMGNSNVEVSAFSITDSVGSYGSLTVTLADHVGGTTPYARFEDGLIQLISANSQFALPGIAVNVDITPAAMPDPLDFVAVAQLTAFPLPDLDDQQNGPIRGIGIREIKARVPEPATIFLLGTSAAAALFQRRRRKIAINKVV